MWDKSKVYGYSQEYIKKYGEPEDNEVMIESHEEEILTIEEINRMFPCQTLGLTNVKWVNKEIDPFSFTAATVAFYHCDAGEANYMELTGKIEYAYVNVPSFMRGDLLWLCDSNLFNNVK